MIVLKIFISPLVIAGVSSLSPQMVIAKNLKDEWLEEWLLLMENLDDFSLCSFRNKRDSWCLLALNILLTYLDNVLQGEIHYPPKSDKMKSKQMIMIQVSAEDEENIKNMHA